MRRHGIHYDIGTEMVGGGTTRPTLTPDQMDREIGDIATGLHADAIRITGGDPLRIAAAAGIAARHGLEAWLSPMLPNADAATTLSAVATTADIAETLRRQGHRVVLVVGCELSVFMSGILPGPTHADRLALLADPDRLIATVTVAGFDPQARFADVLQRAAETARARFNGPLTYASGPWEEVDWTRFEFVGVDAYRDASNRGTYADLIRARVAGGRPVVVTEVGCATYRGAADAGAMAWTAVDRDGDIRRLRTGIEREESEQAAELDDLLRILDDSGVDGAFIYTYVAPSYDSGSDAASDLDAASFALVRSWRDGTTTPKLAYETVGRRYLRATAPVA